MKKLFLALFLLCALAIGAQATTITGTITSPNTTVSLKNGTLTFTLSQAGIIAGSFALTTSTVNCYTSTDGSVVGLPNPLVAPSLSGIAGSIVAGTYYVKVTYYASGVETLASPAQAIVLASTGGISVSAPLVQPAGATGYKIYVGTVLGSETLQQTVSSFTLTTITTYSAGAALPNSNTSACSLAGNDTIIPSGTTYKVNVVDQGGHQVPGFPQNWSVASTTMNVSNGYPIAQNPAVRFPQPILANPSSQAQQSVNSPITLNGFSLSTGRMDVTGSSAPAVAPAGQVRCYFDSTSNKFNCSENGNAYVNLIGGSTGLACSSCTANTVLKYNGSSAVNSSITDTGVTVTISPSGNIVWTPGGRAVLGQATTDATLPKLVVNSRIDVVTATSAASTTALGVSAGNYSSITADITTGGTYLPLAFIVHNAEAGRMTFTADQPGTGFVRNFEFGTPTGGAGTTTYTDPVTITRTQNAATQFILDNQNTGTGGSASYIVKAGGGSNIYLFATGTGYTNASGPIPAASGLYTTNTNGLFFQSTNTTAATGPHSTGGDIQFVFGTGSGTTRVWIAGTTGNVTAPGLTLNTTPLAQTSGGTGQSTAITANRLVYSDGTAYQGNAGLTFNSTSGFLTTQRLVAKAGTISNPPADSGSLQLWYDTASDEAAIMASTNDGSGSGTAKSMYFTAANYFFQVGSPSVFAPKFGVTSNGPKWHIAGTTGAQTPTWGTNLPAAVVQLTPKTYVKIELSDGTIGYVPVFQ